MKSAGERNTNKGITELVKYSNRLNYHSSDLSYMGILVDIRDTLRISRKGWTDRQVVNDVWIGTLTTCLMTVRHKGALAPSHDAG